MKQDHDFRFCLCVRAVCNEYSSCYANALFCTVLDILWTPWDVLERSITSFLFICLPGVPPTHQRKTKYLERKKFQCKKDMKKRVTLGGGVEQEGSWRSLGKYSGFFFVYPYLPCSEQMSSFAGSWQEQLIIKFWTWSILPLLCQNALEAKYRE